jgi:hypothetical protein
VPLLFRTLPRAVVIETLDVLGFREFKMRDTHTLLWAMRDDSGGVGAIVRVPGFELIPPTGQLAILAEGKISVYDWLFAVMQARHRLGISDK